MCNDIVLNLRPVGRYSTVESVALLFCASANIPTVNDSRWSSTYFRTPVRCSNSCCQTRTGRLGTVAGLPRHMFEDKIFRAWTRAESIVYSVLYNDCGINWKMCVTTFSISVNISSRELNGDMVYLLGVLEKIYAHKLYIWIYIWISLL